jgi:hypothetical protein
MQQAGSSSGSTAAAIVAAQHTATAHLQAAVASKGTGRGQEAAAAAAVLEGAVWGAMMSFQQWRLGLLVLSLVARFTGMHATVKTASALPHLVDLLTKAWAQSHALWWQNELYLNCSQPWCRTG